MGTTVTDHQLDALGDILLRQGHCDQRTLERARRVAAESDQRLDAVLIQLGLVSERGLADAYASLLSIPVAAADRYPASDPVLPDRLSADFLRHARAVPLAADAADPGAGGGRPAGRFHPGRRRGRHRAARPAGSRRADRAGGRAEPALSGGQTGRGRRRADAPLEEDAERLKDLASEAPVIRLVNLLITRAVETQASDIHIEPFEDRLRVRYRYDGVLHEAEPPPTAPGRRHHVPHQDHGAARYRRTAHAAGWAHQDGGARPGCGFPRLHDPVAAWRDGGAAHPRPLRRGVRLRPARAVAGGDPQAGVGAGPAERHRAGDRADRQRQDHDALHRAAGAERGHPQDRHGRRPDRVPACRASTRSRCARRSA